MTMLNIGALIQRMAGRDKTGPEPDPLVALFASIREPRPVVAEYDNLAGTKIVIKLIGYPDDPRAVAICTGCGDSETQTFCGYAHFPPEVKEEHVLDSAKWWSQDHAKHCDATAGPTPTDPQGAKA